jgi:hypothetical protein
MPLDERDGQADDEAGDQGLAVQVIEHQQRDHPANMMTRYGLDPLTPQTRQTITESAATMFVHAYARRTQDTSHH